ncbi:MAG: hypothetical protein EHM18_15050 [Acidobacteria bacterium]|nr:MAG: hypothetical protein EHM18_15050 [Acidobacteriota bacterium]
MKVAELREKIRDYTRNRLERVVVEMYKAIPKAVKEDQGIDSLILSPNPGQRVPKERARPDMDEIAFETEEFISNAYNQFYFAPNSVVPKRERPKWRFIARRLFKELNRAAVQPEDAAEAADLLKQLYELLCHSCAYILFSAYDSFESVGISQVEFFRAVLAAKRKVESPPEFVRDSIVLALANSLNRYTLYESLLSEVEAFLHTVDMKERAVEVCDDLRREVTAGQSNDRRLSRDRLQGYNRDHFLQNLAIAGWMWHMALGQPKEAIGYFQKHYMEKNPEIALYVLLRMIEHHGCWALWLKTYDEAVERGVRPRDELRRAYRDIQGKLDGRTKAE